MPRLSSRSLLLLLAAVPLGAQTFTQFRIGVGFSDTAPRTWEGRLRVTGAEIERVRGWRDVAADRFQQDGAFVFHTRKANFENQLNPNKPYGQTDWNDPLLQRLIPMGLEVTLRGTENPRVEFDTPAGRFAFHSSDVSYGKPLTVLGGNGAVERLPVEQTASEAGARDDYPAIAITASGKPWMAWLSYRDKADIVMARGGSQLHRLTDRGDHHAPAIAANGEIVTVAWSQRDGDRWRIYAKTYDGDHWSEAVEVSGAGSNIWPALAADSKGRLALAWQSLRADQSVIAGREFDGKRWGPETVVSDGPGNAWMPSVAYGGGKLWVTWDSYTTGNYQVYTGPWGGRVERVTRSQNFCVRTSVAVTPQGQPVIAWEESDPLWGKDFTFLFDRRGTTLYKNRRVRAAWHDGSNWRELPQVADAAPASIRRFIQQPKLATDPSGRLYLAMRIRTSAATARVDYWAAGGRWETFLTHLDGERWSPVIPMPSSVGRNGALPSIAVHEGRPQLAWFSDNRAFPAARYGELDVYTAPVEVSAPAAKLGGPPLREESVKLELAHPEEAANVRQIRAYRVRTNGKTYRIVRGDLHRHTELSTDGAGDGSLDDLYRYTLDAASMDYAHVADHQMGSDDEYNWWITQKSNDLYYMPRRFVPLYGYERSVWYPNGHRNVVWSERGKPVLSISPAEAKGELNSGPIIYPYLRETNGIATSHSSATEQGTDWRDNDPALEPFVEIYQGFESNYEHAGAPRAWKEGESKVHQGPRPAGYVWNAWEKGYKLGVQSSSDHVSTHSSFAAILVEDLTRPALLDAMRKRHSYAATDSIVLDYRVQTSEGVALMGDIVTSKSRPKLILKVQGTAPIKQIDVIKNNTYIHKISPGKAQASLEYVDNAATKGESYYYVRVEQTDGQLAWSSPVWIRYE